MKKILILKRTFLFAASVLILLSACAASEYTEEPAPDARPEPDCEPPAPVYRRITPTEARQWMYDADTFVLLDVRTEAEFLESRIPGAVLMPYDALVAHDLPDRDTLILIYCRSGRRSATAARELLSLGFTNVADFGGILNWPYETVGD